MKKQLLLFVFLLISKGLFAKSDTLTVHKVEHLETELAAIKMQLHAQQVKTDAIRDNTDVYIGLFERYSARTENLISLALGLIGLLATLGGYFSLRNLHQKIENTREGLRESFDLEHRRLRELIASEVDKVKKLSDSLLANQYTHFRNVGMLSSYRIFDGPMNGNIPRDIHLVFTLLAFEQAYLVVGEDNKEKAGKELMTAMSNVGTVLVVNLKKRLDEEDDRGKVRFVAVTEIMFLNPLREVFQRLSQNTDRTISKLAIRYYAIIMEWDRAVAPLRGKDNDVGNNEHIGGELVPIA